MLTTVNEFYAILRAIVMHSKPDQCTRLNMFAVVDRIDQLNSADAGMTMKHYHKGLFWARDWFNKGQDPSNIVREYDALIVDSVREATMTSLSENGYIVPFDIVLVGEVKCQSCPTSCNDTIEGKRAQLLQKAHEVVRELSTYGKYRVKPIAQNEPEYTAWLSEGQAQEMQASPNFDSVDFLGIRLDASFTANTVPFFQPSWNNLSRSQAKLLAMEGKTSLLDNVAAIATSVSVRFCNPAPSMNYKYDMPAAESIGIVKCENC